MKGPTMSTDLAATEWGTVWAEVSGRTLALVCPGCGAFVSNAYDPINRYSAKEAHIMFHDRVEPNPKENP